MTTASVYFLSPGAYPTSPLAEVGECWKTASVVSAYSLQTKKLQFISFAMMNKLYEL